MATKCTVFASGGGSNFQALLERKEAGDLHVEFVLVAGNNSTAKVFERARINGIPTLHIAPSHFNNDKEYERALLHALEKAGTEIISLAGYMKMLPPPVIQQYRNRIINIHPGLLPAFGGKGMYGMRVHQAVIDYGAKVTGVTVHFADEQYDHGAIIIQEAIKVLDSDTPESLQARVIKLEHQCYWRALEALAQGKLRIEGRRVLGEI